jgi:membrane protein
LSAKPESPIGLVSAFCLGALLGVGLSIGEGRAATPPQPAARPKRRPWELSPQSWRIVIAATLREFGKDRIPAAAAGVTFYILLALFPAISAFVSLYGLVSDVSDAQREIASLHGVMPGGVLSIIGAELTRLTQTSHNALSLAFAVSLAISIWSANAGMKALIDALNVAYEAAERRGFVALTGLSLAFTGGTIGLAVLVLSVAAAATGEVGDWGIGAGVLVAWLRWPLIVAGAIVAFSVLYRWGPCRPGASWVWITPGSVFAAVAWMAASGLFSWYVANFGHYDKTYGSLGAIVGCLTWVWLSLMILLLGAELNRELEKQAARETRPPVSHAG